MESIESTKLRWTNGRLMAVGELALIAAIFTADAYHLIPLSKITFLLVVGWLSLRLRGLRWLEIQDSSGE